MPEIAPFADEHLNGAAALLARRHALHRVAEPLLPPRYEDEAAALAEVEHARRADGAAGVVAVEGGRVVGYLVGASKDEAVWGPNVWVESAGHAVAEAEVARDLYARIAADWVEQGRTRHYVLVPASDGELVDSWFRLSFGAQHAHGIRELADDAHFPPGVREAVEDDVPALVALAPLLGRHQAGSPVFGSERSYTEGELRADIEQDLASRDVGTLVAEHDGRIVANFVVTPLEASSAHVGLARPEGTSYLAWAATVPDARGSGAGVALTEASFAWARARGYPTMVTDWRVTNLLSSRFWPRRGFRTTFLRLYRSIP